MARLLPLILLLPLLLVPAVARADDFLPSVQSCSADVAGKGCTPVGAAFGGAWDVAVSPDGRFAYVAAFDANALVVMDRNAATGALTFRSCVSAGGTGGCAPARAMDQPSDIAIAPDGATLYLATRGAGLAVFNRNATTGALTQPPGQDGCVERLFQTEGCLPVNGIAIGEGTVSLRFGPGADPTDLYAGTPSGGLLNLERAAGTGVLSQLAGTVGCARDDGNFSCFNTTAMGSGEIRQFAVSPDGRHVYVPSSGTASGVAILDRAAATGTLTQKPDSDGCITATGNPIGGQNQCLKDVRLAGNPLTLEISPDGRQVYVAAGDRVAVLARDGASGLLSVASTAGARNVRSALYLAISPDGEDLVVGDSGAGSGLAFFHRGAGGALVANAGADGCLSATGDAGACRSHPAVGADGHITFFGSDQIYAGFFSSSSVLAIKRDFAPRCADVSLTVPADTALAIPLACSDRNGDALTLSLASAPAAGQLGAIDASAGRVFYNPFGGFAGSDAFRFRAFGGGQTSNVATASLTVVAAAPAGAPGIAGGGLDADRDGFSAGQDCNDGNAAIRPGALEIRGNRVDENCDGIAEPFATVTSGVSAKWDIHGAKFKLAQLTIANPPKGAKLEFRCSGRGCPVTKKTLSGKTRRGLLDVRPSLGAKLRYRAGQTIEVRIGAAGFNTKVAQLKLRAGRIPSVVALCIPPGGAKPQRRCT